MMPILHSSGVITPGQLGPMSNARVPAIAALTRNICKVGMPSVIQTMSFMPASTASKIASAA